MGLVGPLVGGIVGGLGVTSASVASALWQRNTFVQKHVWFDVCAPIYFMKILNGSCKIRYICLMFQGDKRHNM